MDVSVQLNVLHLEKIFCFVSLCVVFVFIYFYFRKITVFNKAYLMTHSMQLYKIMLSVPYKLTGSIIFFCP